MGNNQKRYKTLVTLLILVSGCFNCAHSQAKNATEPLSNLWCRNEITIVVTDSGLGGLSVVDDIASKMKESGIFSRVNLIFVNALFDASSGYNSLPDRAEKIKALNSVLSSINEKYKPDIILIACNTLSVIYKDTDFVRTSSTPVYGIVESGVRLIAERLFANVNSGVIIFGTETTIQEGSHKKALIDMGIDENRIITKECPQLQSYIEQNPVGEETELLISVYLNEALESIKNDNEEVYLSLNCSHFGYSEELWEKTAAIAPFKSGGILNPNSRMAGILMNENYRNRFPDTSISFSVVSKVMISNKKTIAALFRKNAPELAEAIINYTLDTTLFSYPLLK